MPNDMLAVIFHVPDCYSLCCYHEKSNPEEFSGMKTGKENTNELGRNHYLEYSFAKEKKKEKLERGIFWVAPQTKKRIKKKKENKKKKKIGITNVKDLINHQKWLPSW